MHTLGWVAAVLACVAILLAGFAYAERGDAGLSGLLLLVGFVFASQWWRLKKWAARIDRADAEADNDA
jgi:hypothetical protein